MQKTEVAITLMKAVLDSPEPVKHVNELVKAQLAYFAAAADALSTVQGEIEELAVAAEGEYRCVRRPFRAAQRLMCAGLGSLATTEVPLT